MSPNNLPPVIGSTLGLSAEETIARQVVYTVLPALEEMLITLGRLSKVWNTPQNGIPEKIAAAAAAGEALAGYDPNDWIRWGEALLALNVFLATPITVTLADGSTEQRTPESYLLTRYTPAGGNNA